MNLRGLRINVSEIICYLDIVFLMLINMDYTQAYYANADTKAQTSAKCAKLKPCSITNCVTINISDLGQSVKYSLKLYIEQLG